MEVTMKIFKQQAEALRYLSEDNTEVSEVLYGGGARGGKSWLGCLWQLTRRLSLPGSVGLIAREELSKLRDTTLVTFFKVTKALHLEDAYTFNSGRLIANFRNGSTIYFREIKWLPSDPEFDRLGSYDLTDALLDEAQQIRQKAISVLRGRFSVLSGDNPDGTKWHTIPKALYTCNPKKNWIYADFYKPDKLGTLPNYRKFIRSLPVDNPHVDPAYIDNLLRADPVTVQRLYFGNFDYDDDPSALCSFDAISDLFTNDHVEEVGAKSMSADIAGKGRDRFVGYTAIGNVFRVSIDMAYSPGKLVETALKNQMIRDGVPRSLTIVDADGIGSFLESYLNGIKEFHGNSKPMDDRYDNLKSECAFKLAELINRRAIKIICTPEQREKIMEELSVLKQANIDNDTGKFSIIKKEMMKLLLGRSPDYLDGLIMAMYWRRGKPSAGPQATVQRHRTE